MNIFCSGKMKRTVERLITVRFAFYRITEHLNICANTNFSNCGKIGTGFAYSFITFLCWAHGMSLMFWIPPFWNHISKYSGIWKSNCPLPYGQIHKICSGFHSRVSFFQSQSYRKESLLKYSFFSAFQSHWPLLAVNVKCVYFRVH